MDILFAVIIFLLIFLSLFSFVRFISNSIRRQNSQRTELYILNQKLDEALENQRKMMEKVERGERLCIYNLQRN